MTSPDLRRVLNHITWSWGRRELLLDSKRCDAAHLPDPRYLDDVTTSLVRHITHVAAVRDLMLVTAPRVVWELIHYPHELCLLAALQDDEPDEPDERGRRERFDPVYALPHHDPRRSRAEATVSAWAVPAMFFEPWGEPRAVVIPPMR